MLIKWATEICFMTIVQAISATVFVLIIYLITEKVKGYYIITLRAWEAILGHNVIARHFHENHDMTKTVCDLVLIKPCLLISRVTLYTAGHLHTAVPHCSHSRVPIVHTAVPRENNEHGWVYLRCRAVCKLPGCVEGHPWILRNKNILRLRS